MSTDPVTGSGIERIAAEYSAPLWRLTGGYAGRLEDRQDLHQEILAEIWRSLPAFRGECSERTWIYRIAHNVAITWSVRRTQRCRVEVTGVEASSPLDTATPESALLHRERRALLASAIRAMEGIDKQIVISHLEGLSNAEVAEVAGMTEGAVATRLTRLRSRLAEQIGGKRK